MNENIKVTENPNHYIVLEAISKGTEDAAMIAKVTKIRKDDVETILNDLLFERLIVMEVKKRRGLFGNKNVQEARITDTGDKLLSSKKQELEEKARDLKAMYGNEDRQGIQSFMDNNRAWLPMMLFSGIMSALVFASMMSFMSIAMNPAEAQMSSDAANVDMRDTTATSTNTQSSFADDNDVSSPDGIDNFNNADVSSGFDLADGDLGGDFSF